MFLENPNLKIYGNLHLNKTFFSTFIFSKFLVISWSDIINSKHPILILGDDMKNLSKMGNLNAMICSASRKKSVYIFFTGQHYTHIKPEIRTQLDYVVIPELIMDNKNNQSLIIEHKCKEHKGSLIEFGKSYIENPIQEVGNLYDTNEVVAFNVDSEIKKELLKQSKDLLDLEINCNIVYKSEVKALKVFRELCKHF